MSVSLYTSYNYNTLSTVDTNIIPLALVIAILNIPNSIALALLYPKAFISISVYHQQLYKMKTTLSPEHTGK